MLPFFPFWAFLDGRSFLYLRPEIFFAKPFPLAYLPARLLQDGAELQGIRLFACHKAYLIPQTGSRIKSI